MANRFFFVSFGSIPVASRNVTNFAVYASQEASHNAPSPANENIFSWKLVRSTFDLLGKSAK